MKDNNWVVDLGKNPILRCFVGLYAMLIGSMGVVGLYAAWATSCRSQGCGSIEEWLPLFITVIPMSLGLVAGGLAVLLRSRFAVVFFSIVILLNLLLSGLGLIFAGNLTGTQVIQTLRPIIMQLLILQYCRFLKKEDILV